MPPEFVRHNRAPAAKFHFAQSAAAFRIPRRGDSVPFWYGESTVGNKDRRKEKKKLKQPKEAPKPATSSRMGGARPAK